MALIPDLPASASLASTDVFAKDTGSTTQKITAENLAKGLASILPINYTSVPITNSKVSGSITAFTYGKILLVQLNASIGTAIGTAEVIATLPSGYRPNYDRYFNFPPQSGGQGFLQLSSNGQILLGCQTSGSTTSGWCRGTFISITGY